MSLCRHVLLVAIATQLACPAAPPEDPNHPPRLDKHYADGVDGLHALWQDILVASQRDDREKVHLLMASMVMTNSDLTTLLGEARTRQLGPRYSAMIARVVNAGAMELVATIAEKKYDEVEVFSVDGSASDGDRATIKALPAGTKLFGVRLKRKGQALGLRYDFFVYRNGHWMTGSQLAKYLVELPPPQVTVDPSIKKPPDASGTRGP